MKKETNELVVREHYALDSMGQMTELAKVLKDHIVKNNLFTIIVGKKYAHVDGWAYAGSLIGVFPRVVKTENLSSGTEKKWKADVELVSLKNGNVLGFGTAICSNAETKKRTFDEYAVLSMAQTRAIGKAYRNTLGWVMKLGNSDIEATTAEEMVKGGAVDIKIEIPDTGEVGLQSEMGAIIELLQGFGFKTINSRLAAVNRLMKWKLEDFRMTKTQARDLQAALLKKKLEAKK